MLKVQGMEGLPPRVQQPVVSIGAYDGVHLGHQKILSRAVEEARRRGTAAALVSFSPHPQKVIAPDTAPPLLQTPQQREEFIAELGIDFLVEVPFTRHLSQLSPRQFVEQVLMRRPVSQVHVGFNFRFGHRRRGDVETLRQLGRENGFQVFAVDPVTLRGQRISSSKIRTLLGGGNVQRARRYLGRPYEIHGTIVQGDQRGRTIGFPTLNIDSVNELLPAQGVYVGRAVLEGSRYGCVTNIGYRPTVHPDYQGRPLVESHLFDFQEEVYGLPVNLQFCCRLREEKRFDGLKSLTEQIKKDSRRALRYLRQVEARERGRHHENQP
ncbi:MAG TPA: bifunctional riboflavin kinase/FAD synthetase [Acidobacteriota bacterium]|nr:bifunctional riboflavin kinase/FAD synthetase [Acidobacteriota bacterium]